MGDTGWDYVSQYTRRTLAPALHHLHGIECRRGHHGATLLSACGAMESTLDASSLLRLRGSAGNPLCPYCAEAHGGEKAPNE